MNKKKISIIGDSILARQCEENLKPYPSYIFKNFDINIKKFYSGTTNVLFSDDIVKDTFLLSSDIIIIHLGICDCWTRFIKNNKGIFTKNFRQNVPINIFIKNILLFIKLFKTKTKILFISIVKPHHSFCKTKNFNYDKIVYNEIDKYNNIFMQISSTNSNLFYLNAQEEIDNILNKYSLKYNDIFFDGSAHTTPQYWREDESNTYCGTSKEKKQKIIKIYSEIIYNSIKHHKDLLKLL